VALRDDPGQFAGSGRRQPPLHITASENAILGSMGVLNFAQSDRFVAEEKPLPNERALAELPKLLRWTDRRNIYEVRSQSYTNVGSLAHVKDWEKFWKIERTGSLQGRLRFRFGEPLGHDLRPESFRLQTESLGQAARPDRRDLGVDVDLIGPGPAYERWMKTDDHKMWLKNPMLNPDR
jgi:hypothetical protein